MMRLQLQILALALCSWASVARAQEPSVKELFDNGQIHYDSGQFDLALEAWEEAYRLSNRAILLIKMADAHEALGELDEAIELLDGYRDSAEDAELASITARMEDLRARQAAALSTTPVPVPDPVEPEPEPEPTRRRPLALDLTLGGLTAGGVALGTGAGLVALGARSTAMESCAEAAKGVVCTRGASDALARDRSTSAVADVGFVLGGAAAIAWTVSAVAIRPGASDLRVAPTANGAVISWTPR